MDTFVYFDAVGTLIEAHPSVTTVYQSVARQHGLELSAETLRSRFAVAIRHLRGHHAAADPDPATSSRSESRSRQARPIRPDHEASSRALWQTIVSEVFPERPGELIMPLFETLWTHFGQASSWRLMPGVTECLSRLAETGTRWGIASNFDSRLRAVVAGLIWPTPPSVIVLGPEIDALKPNADFFRHCEAVAVPARRFALWGDDFDEDIVGANQAGWTTIWVTPTEPDEGRLLAAGLSDVAIVGALNEPPRRFQVQMR